MNSCVRKHKNVKARAQGLIVSYPTIHYSAMLHYVPSAIWLGKSRNYK